MINQICVKCGKSNEFSSPQDDCLCGMKCRVNAVLVYAIKNNLLTNTRVYNPEYIGELHLFLSSYKDIQSYTFSKYIDGIKSGNYNDGILIEDLHNTSFSDSAFDVIFVMDILEHTYNYIQALKELIRISAKHILLSIPLESANTTLVATEQNGVLVHHYPPKYHSDFNGNTVLVYVDFGKDILQQLEVLFTVREIPFDDNYLLVDLIVDRE